MIQFRVAGFTRWIQLVLVFCSIVFLVKEAQAHNFAKTKEEKYFDIDNSGRLDLYEKTLLRTHLITKYPLITKNKQIPYDFNKNRMMDPFEMQTYLKDKKNGKLLELTDADKAFFKDGTVRFETMDSNSKSK